MATSDRLRSGAIFAVARHQEARAWSFVSAATCRSLVGSQPEVVVAYCLTTAACFAAEVACVAFVAPTILHSFRSEGHFLGKSRNTPRQPPGRPPVASLQQGWGGVQLKAWGSHPPYLALQVSTQPNHHPISVFLPYLWTLHAPLQGTTPSRWPIGNHSLELVPGQAPEDAGMQHVLIISRPSSSPDRCLVSLVAYRSSSLHQQRMPT